MGYYDFKTVGGGAKAYYLGDYASGVQINVAAKYDDYAMLTADNFIIQPKAASFTYVGIRVGHHTFDNGIEPGDSADISVQGGASLTTPSISYDSSTGMLSFTLSLVGISRAGIWDSTSEASKGDSMGVTAKVYLVTEIESL